MMKIQIGLGVLALPAAFNDVGLIPGVLLLSFVGGIVAWTAWVVDVFKLRHREVYCIGATALSPVPITLTLEGRCANNPRSECRPDSVYSSSIPSTGFSSPMLVSPFKKPQ